MDKCVLAFLAHPDDAEFLCCGTLICLADPGWTVHIATAIPGDCGSLTADRWSISATRTTEAVRAAAMIGAAYHCLDERDGLVVYDQTAIQKTMDLFRRIAPALVFTHAPKDYMLDHEQVSLLARAASFLFAAPNISTTPAPRGSHVPHLYYWDPIEGVDSLGNPVHPTTLIDITGQLEKKSAMLACHASQRQWLQAHHGMDEYLAAMTCHAAGRGRQIGTAAAEGFIQHRGACVSSQRPVG